MTTIPKSLHTVTVLVAVARTFTDERPDMAIALALAVLGYDGAPDTYQLAYKARKILAKQVAA